MSQTKLLNFNKIKKCSRCGQKNKKELKQGICLNCHFIDINEYNTNQRNICRFCEFYIEESLEEKFKGSFYFCEKSNKSKSRADSCINGFELRKPLFDFQIKIIQSYLEDFLEVRN